MFLPFIFAAKFSKIATPEALSSAALWIALVESLYKEPSPLKPKWSKWVPIITVFSTLLSMNPITLFPVIAPSPFTLNLISSCGFVLD